MCMCGNFLLMYLPVDRLTRTEEDKRSKKTFNRFVVSFLCCYGCNEPIACDKFPGLITIVGGIPCLSLRVGNRSAQCRLGREFSRDEDVATHYSRNWQSPDDRTCRLTVHHWTQMNESACTNTDCIRTYWHYPRLYCLGPVYSCCV